MRHLALIRLPRGEARATMAAPSTTGAETRHIPRPASGWQESALCSQVDPDLWFGESGAHCVEARQICAGCPVVAACLQDALADNAYSDVYGIRGGLSPRQRAKLRRKLLDGDDKGAVLAFPVRHHQADGRQEAAA